MSGTVDFSKRPKKTGQGFIEREGEQIYYESIGEGPAIVIAHGMGGNHLNFFQQIPDLAKNYRVVLFDQRGFGQSTNKHLKHGPHTSAEDMKAVMDHLGIDKAHLLGQSMGGWTVLDFAMNHPERTLSLVLSNSIAGVYNEEVKDYYIIPAKRPPVATLPLGKHFGLADGFYERNPEMAILYVQINQVSAKAPEGMRALIRNTYYPVDDINKMDFPILFITGSEDVTFPPEWIAHLHRLIPRSEFKKFEGTAHSPYYELPHEYNKVIANFVSKY